MATIDLIVLGMLKKEPLSAYDLQKLVEYRNISKWVKISTPSIYKKVIQLEEKGYISSHIEKEGKMPEKSVYSLTEKGKQQFEKLMLEISCKPINIFLDFNAVIVNLDSMSRERQQECLDNIESSMEVLKKYLEENKYDIVSGEFTRIPTDTKELTPEQRAEVDKILDKLDEDDDVTNVYHNIKED